MSDLSERAYRRNLIVLVLDHISFSVGFTFLGFTTILPNLIRRLGGSPVAVGALGAIQAGGWLLPQLLAGRYVANQPFVKKYIVLPAAVSRVILFLLVPALLVWAVPAPGLALAALLVTIGAFNMADAFSAVGWFDLLGKAIPVERRGRVLGGAQSLGSFLSIGAGFAVEAILARSGLYPANYALLILLAALILCVGVVAVASMREPRAVAEPQAQLPWRKYFPYVLLILRRDARFAWLTIAGWLAGLADMAGAFYVLYATGRLQIPEKTIGLFVSAGVVGGFLSGAVLGPLGDRKGPVTVIKVVMGLRCAIPALALLAPLVAGHCVWLASAAFVVLFVVQGVIYGAYLVGAMSYLLAIAPPGERSLYVALSNTLGGLLLVTPLVAGWLIEATSYEFLFAVALGMAALSLAVALCGPGRFALLWRGGGDWRRLPT